MFPLSEKVKVLDLVRKKNAYTKFTYGKNKFPIHETVRK